MVNSELQKLMQCFPRSYINGYGEVIIHHYTNTYFKIDNIENDIEFKYKVLEWLSRAACITKPYATKKSNLNYNTFILTGINEFLHTNFTDEDMSLIYEKLGNSVNRELTINFVDSDYDMSLLRTEEVIS